MRLKFCNSAIMTPAFLCVRRQTRLPVFDASEKGSGIQNSCARMAPKSRRQNPAVGGGVAPAKMEASETGKKIRAKRMEDAKKQTSEIFFRYFRQARQREGTDMAMV
jgi:hypothetical protein